MKSADKLDPFNRLLVRSLVGLSLSLFCIVDLEASNGLTPFAKQTAYYAGCRTCSADHSGRFLHARPEAQSVYGAARESHNECTRIF